MLSGEGTSPDNDLNEIHLSAVQEAMNQMMGAAATSMSTIFNKMVNISPPSIELGKATGQEDYEQSSINLPDEILVKVSFQLKIGELIDSSIMQLIPFPFAHELVEQLLNGPESKEEAQVPLNEQSEEDIQSDDVQEIQAPITNDRNVEENQYLRSE